MKTPNFVFLTKENDIQLFKSFGQVSNTHTRKIVDLTDSTKDSGIETYQEGVSVGAFLNLNYLNPVTKAPIVHKATGDTFTGINLYIDFGRYARNMSTSSPEVKESLARLQKDQVVRISGPWHRNRTTGTKSIRVTDVQVLVADEAGKLSWIPVDLSWPVYQTINQPVVEATSLTDVATPESEYEPITA